MTGQEALPAVRVKICGITSPEDARVAARAGADAIGLVFYRGSARAVDTGMARRIIQALPPFVTTVGLFVEPLDSQVRDVLAVVPLDVLQFHGEETDAFCAGFGRPWIKALRPEEADVRETAARYPGASGLLLDARVPGQAGGTGRTFDWSLVPSELPRPCVLAGGLTPENVGDAVAAVGPWAVDVSSGVEASPGVKDPDKVARFIRNARQGA